MDMDKVTLLTASRLEPTVAIRPHSTVVARLGRTLAIPLQLHHRFKHISSFICLQTYFISSTLLISTRYALFYAFLASAFILKHAFAMSSKAIVDVWDSKSIQKVRARIFYEFAVFILGCGNAIFLIVFWPGWLILAPALFALWQLTG